MDEEGINQRMRELQQENSQLKGLLKSIAAVISEDAVDIEARYADGLASSMKDAQSQLQEENAVDIWKHIYNWDDGLPFKTNKGASDTLCLEISKTKKNALLFKNLTLNFRGNENAIVRTKRKKGSFSEAVGLITTDSIIDKNILTPEPLPKNGVEPRWSGSAYIVCRILYPGTRGGKKLKIYFSKEWSKVIRNSPTFIDTNLIEINDLWMLNKKEANLMLPCKALCRLEGRELLINVPPWLPLAFSTQKNEAQTNIWISYYSETSERIVRGYLSKKGKTFSHYRCSRKKPWDFYTTMVGEMKGDTKKTIDFMISFTPEAAFQSSNVQ